MPEGVDAILSRERDRSAFHFFLHMKNGTATLYEHS